MKLILATQNPNKVAEIAPFVPAALDLKSLADLAFFDELSEDGNTLEANARQKALFVFEKFGENCFADDTGLEVTALNGAPGVFSARYGGPEKSAEKNMQKLLAELAPHSDRSARFRTVISLFWEGQEHVFEGIVNGVICFEKQGTDGFGYDPIFQPNGETRTFAQMTKEEKNKLSHRGLALKKLLTFINTKSA